MPRCAWEYLDLSLEYEGTWSDELNKLGKEEWQVVLAIHDESVEGDKEIRVLLMRSVSSVGGKATSEGRVTKRKSKTAPTGHEVVEDEESDEDA